MNRSVYRSLLNTISGIFVLSEARALSVLLAFFLRAPCRLLAENMSNPRSEQSLSCRNGFWSTQLPPWLRAFCERGSSPIRRSPEMKLCGYHPWLCCARPPSTAAQNAVESKPPAGLALLHGIAAV